MARQERSLRTSRLIVDTAAQVFSELGYAGTTTTEILSRCRVTRGALYFHFPSKWDLALAVLAEASAVQRTSQCQLALQRLIEFNLEYANQLQTDVVMRASVRLRAELGHQGAALPEGGDVHGVFLKLLSEAGEAGEMPPSADPGEVADMLAGASVPVSLFQAHRESELTQHVATLWRYLLPSVSDPGLLINLKSFLGRVERRMREQHAALPGADVATEPGSARC